MGKLIKISPGDRFSRITIVREIERRWFKNGKFQRMVMGVCDCGKEIRGQLHDIRQGKMKSCGCLINEKRKISKRTHGMTLTKPYRAWRNMKGRCLDRKNKSYPDYGGRGIKMCDRWINSFENFREDMKSGYSDDLVIDRKNNDLGYFKDNCHRTTVKVNNRNKRNCIMYEGKCLKEWSLIKGVNYGTLKSRVKGGWMLKDVIHKTVKQKNTATKEGKL